MKVLFIAPANSIHTVRWVNALADKGLEVILVSLKNHRERVNQVSKAVKIVYLPVSGFEGYYFNSYFLKKEYNREKPDIVNAHYASGYGTLVRVAKIPNVILSVWGSDVYEFPYQNAFKMKVIKKNLLWAKYIASTSKIMAIQTQSLSNKKLNITVTPFGVDCNKLKKEKKERSEAFSICIIKSLLPVYRIDVLIDAFFLFIERVKEKKCNVNIRLDIYGEGYLLETLKQQVEKLNLSKCVFFHGYVENNYVPEILNQTDIFCCCSQNESFGVSAVEAMACEIPVIATEANGFKEVIEDGKTGFIVEKNNPSEMSKYMLLLYDDSKLREEMGSAGRSRVKRLYDWEKNVETMIALYTKVVSE